MSAPIESLRAFVQARQPGELERTLRQLIAAKAGAEPDDASAALLDCDETLLALDEGLTRLVHSNDLDDVLALPNLPPETAAILDALFEAAFRVLRGMRRAYLLRRVAILRRHPNPIARTIANLSGNDLELVRHAAELDAKYGGDTEREYNDFLREHGGKTPTELLGL